MTRYIIGIDNGVSGGIVVLDKVSNNIVFKTVMPVFGKSKKEYDVQTISGVLKSFSEDAVAYLERAQPQFRDGKKQAFKTGYGFGVMEGVLAALNIPYFVVAPKVWQKRVFAGLQSDDTKLASLMFCKRTWPTVDWTPTARANKAHDGLTDAACLAYYGGVNGF